MPEAKLKLHAAKDRAKRHIRQNKRLSNLRILYVRSLSVLWNNKWVFLGILLIYGVINCLLAQSITGGLNVNNLKITADGLFHGQFQTLSGSM